MLDYIINVRDVRPVMGVSPPYCATRPSVCVAPWGRGITHQIR